MKFLLDEDLAPAIADIARRQGLDVVSVHEVDREAYRAASSSARRT